MAVLTKSKKEKKGQGNLPEKVPKENSLPSGNTTGSKTVFVSYYTDPRYPDGVKADIPTFNQLKEACPKPDRLVHDYTPEGLKTLGKLLFESRQEFLIYDDYRGRVAPISLRNLCEYIKLRTGRNVSKDALNMLEQGVIEEPRYLDLKAIAKIGYVRRSDGTLYSLKEILQIACGLLEPKEEKKLAGVVTRQGLIKLAGVLRKARAELRMTTRELSQYIHEVDGSKIPISLIESLESGYMPLPVLRPRELMIIESVGYVKHPTENRSFTSAELLAIACEELDPETGEIIACEELDEEAPQCNNNSAN